MTRLSEPVVVRLVVDRSPIDAMRLRPRPPSALGFAPRGRITQSALTPEALKATNRY